MTKYFGLVNWTDQGIGKIKDSPARVDSVRDMAKKFGCSMTDFNMTMGIYDMVVTIEAPYDATLAKFLLSLGSLGTVRTTTLRAFPEEEYRKIIGGL